MNYFWKLSDQFSACEFAIFPIIISWPSFGAIDKTKATTRRIKARQHTRYPLADVTLSDECG